MNQEKRETTDKKITNENPAVEDGGDNVKKGRLSHIPTEISRFIEKRGVSLLIRGTAGTGKTNLLYRLMEEVSNQEIILWTNHPLSSQKLERYPFLREKLFLGKDTIERSLAIQRMYEHIQKLPTNSPIIIFLDDVERLVSRYLSAREHHVRLENEVDSLIQAIENEFLAKHIANLVMTSEKVDDGSLIHMAGGCVTLARTQFMGRVVRELEINKLEDTQVLHKTYIFSLTDGIFSCIQPLDNRTGFKHPAKFDLTLPSGDYFSTGNRSLDGILGGGYRAGSFNMYEVASEVPEWVYLSIIYPSIYNFILMDCGVILSVAGSQTPVNIQRNITPVVGESGFSSLVRILTPFTQATRQQYVLSAHSESSKERLNIWKNAVAHLKVSTNNRTVLDITAFSALEHTFEKPALLQMIDEGIKRINYEGDIGIGIVHSEGEITKSLANISDNLFKIVEINGVYAIFGTKPKTDIFVIDFREGSSEFELFMLS